MVELTSTTAANIFVGGFFTGYLARYFIGIAKETAYKIHKNKKAETRWDG